MWQTVFRKLNYIFIWTWYNDWFRLFVIMTPTYMVFLIPFCLWIGVPNEYMKNVLFSVYLIGLGLAFVYNDYSNLRKIGMDENRNTLKT